jgi:hypothetical protein
MEIDAIIERTGNPGGKSEWNLKRLRRHPGIHGQDAHAAFPPFAQIKGIAR